MKPRDLMAQRHAVTTKPSGGLVNGNKEGGHRLVPIFGKSRVEVNDPEASAKSLMDAVLSGWTLPDTRVAVVQDWMKGCRGEVDDINTLVAREQRRLGAARPSTRNWLK